MKIAITRTQVVLAFTQPERDFLAKHGVVNSIAIVGGVAGDAVGLKLGASSGSVAKQFSTYHGGEGYVWRTSFNHDALPARYRKLRFGMTVTELAHNSSNGLCFRIPTMEERKPLKDFSGGKEARKSSKKTPVEGNPLSELISAVQIVNGWAEKLGNHLVLSVDNNRLKFLMEG